MGGAGVSFDELIESIYGAVGTSDLWPHAMSMLADFTGSTSTCLFIWNKQEGRFSLTAPSRRMDPKANALYENHYSRIDEAIPPLMRKASGEPFACQDHFSDAYVQRSEFYNEFLIPMGGVRYRVGTRLLEDKDVTALLAVNRNMRAGPFEPGDISLIGRIGQHVTRAAELHLRITNLAAQNEMLTGVLDRSSEGIIVVDPRGKVLAVNRSAERVIAASNTLTVRNGRLEARQPDDSNRLRHAVAAATSSRDHADAPASTIAIGSTSSSRPLIVSIARLALRNAVRFGASAPAAAIFFTAPLSSTDESILVVRFNQFELIWIL
jgi:PAS domain-containing protein